MTVQPSGTLSATSALVFKYNYSAACREKFKNFFESYLSSCDAKVRSLGLAQVPTGEEGPLVAELFVHAPLCHKTEHVGSLLSRLQSKVAKSIALFMLEEALTFTRAVRDAMLDDRDERFDRMRNEGLAEKEKFRKIHENVLSLARAKGIPEENVVYEVNGQAPVDVYALTLKALREADRLFLQDFNGALLDHIHFLRDQIDILQQGQAAVSNRTVAPLPTPCNPMGS